MLLTFKRWDVPSIWNIAIRESQLTVLFTITVEVADVVLAPLDAVNVKSLGPSVTLERVMLTVTDTFNGWPFLTVA